MASLEWNLCWETNSELMCNLHSVPETGIADRLRADTTRPEPNARTCGKTSAGGKGASSITRF